VAAIAFAWAAAEPRASPLLPATATTPPRTLRDDSQGRLGKPHIHVRERSSHLRILRRSDIDSRPEPDIVQQPPPTLESPPRSRRLR
jgi:hypothetical protein